MSVTYAVCVDNRFAKVSLEVGKLYRVRDPQGAALLLNPKHISIWDESGAAFTYRGSRFVLIEIPTGLHRKLRKVYGKCTERVDRSDTQRKQRTAKRRCI